MVVRLDHELASGDRPQHPVRGRRHPRPRIPVAPPHGRPAVVGRSSVRPLPGWILPRRVLSRRILAGRITARRILARILSRRIRSRRV
jgi:hypothetical protein